MIFALLCWSLQAADLTGTWVGTVTGRNGDLQDVAFQLRQQGEAISGKLYGDYGSSPIVEGKTADGKITFVVVIAEQNGNQINTTRLRFNGRFENGKLELTRQREGSTNAGNGGGVQSREGPGQAMSLRKLY
ncbi:MAG: hypothetical protein HYZ37_07225 [Candidatus Solibacter usitatus]|nr:hypothetical protein [Candidatus Solibacter usitatus]